MQVMHYLISAITSADFTDPLLSDHKDKLARLIVAEVRMKTETGITTQIQRNKNREQLTFYEKAEMNVSGFINLI